MALSIQDLKCPPKREHVNLDMLPFTEMSSTTTASGRVYVTPEGNAYPSVTTFLSATDDKEWYDAWVKKMGGLDKAKAEAERCAVRGECVHLAAEYYLRNYPMEKVEDAAGKYMRMFQKLRPFLNRINNVRALEIPLYSDIMQLAGRVDCIGDFDGIPSIVDFKTSLHFKPEGWIENYFLQATAYSIMLEERYGIVHKQIAILIAVEKEPRGQLYVKWRDDYMSLLARRIKEFRKQNSTTILTFGK